jgi:hypothetical protein
MLHRVREKKCWPSWVCSCALILLVTLACNANEGKPFFGKSFFANAGVAFFPSSHFAGEISEWVVLNKVLPIPSVSAQEPWLGFDQGIYFDQDKTAGYLDVKFAICGPFETAVGVSAGAQFNNYENPFMQNLIWISYPSIISPSLSAKFVYESWIPHTELGVSVKVPIFFQGFNH